MKIFLILIICSLLISCSQKENKKTRLTIKFEKNKSSLEKDFGLGDPTSYAELNCFGIFVDYPEIDSGNACTIDPSTPFKLVRPDVVGGLIPINGGELSLDVLAGQGRKIQIVAFKADAPADFCPSVLVDFDPYEDHMSHPFVIAEEIHNIPPGEYNITIPARYLTGTNANTKLDDCVGPFFQSSSLASRQCYGIDLCQMNLIGDFSTYNDSSCLTAVISIDPVRCWKDIDGSSYSFLATGAQLPLNAMSVLNGRSVVRFDSIQSSYLNPTPDLSLSGSQTIAVVVHAGSTPVVPSTLLGYHNGANDGIALEINNANNFLGRINNYTDINTSALVATNSKHVVLMSYNDTQMYLCVDLNCNSPITYTGGFPTVMDLYLGANNQSGIPNNFTNFDIAEIVIFNKYLGSTERDGLINSLKSSWGIP